MSRISKEVSARSYIATAPFHLNFFTYKVNMAPVTFVRTGDLSRVTGATALTCPAGRILRENGKKLFPGAHPISTVNGVAATFPDSTVMVGVFDNQSGLSGFIDVNAPMFAGFNGDRPNYLKDAVDPVGGLTDRSAPTLTNGAVDILETLNVTGTSTLKGGVKVATTGTLITRILKGIMQADANLSAQGAGTGPGGSQILTCPLPVTASIDDSIIVTQRGDIGGWVQTSCWIEGGNAKVKMMFQGSAPGQGAVTRPEFNFTLIQS